MASVPSRKKSLVGANGSLPFIDIPQPSNQLLNKSASSSTSLYQQCSQLRAKLVRIHGFAPFLTLASPMGSSGHRQSQSTDPVRQLWDCLALGTPLCFLYNLLPDRPPLDVNPDPEDVDVDDLKGRKKATAKFVIGITEMKNSGQWTGESFTVTELLNDIRDTNGFVKVVSTVMKLVDMLPPNVFDPEELPPSPPSLPTPYGPGSAVSLAGSASIPSDGAVGDERERNQVLRELVETERKYVGDLEVMREYANQLGSSGAMDLDTIHKLFPGLNKLLDFQRQFLIVLEGIYELPWQQQRWGNAFTSKEEEFDVYDTYCANYSNAADLLLREEQNLMNISGMINAKSELPAFLIKPVQRICKYPLLLESLVKRAGPDYPYMDELVEGVTAAKRITDRVNEAQRREENAQTVKLLEQRVEDWKGHHLSHFGHLLLDDIFFVTKSDVDREYHVFLFEKIILCCKEAIPTSASQNQNRKSAKSNSLLKNKPGPGTPLPPAMTNKKKTTPLLLKGRIFLNNVTAATPSRKDGYSLQVWWKGDDVLEFFTLRCRTEEQLKQWETTIIKLINQNQPNRRGSERPPPSASAGQTSFNPQQVSYPPTQSRLNRYPSGQYGGEFPITPATPGMYPNGQGYPLHPQRERVDSRGTDENTDEGDWIGEDRGYDSPYSSSVPSGRATPNGMRRPHASMPAQKGATVPLPINGARGPMNRGMSAGSDGSFGPGVNPPPGAMRPLRSQFSSTRLRSTYEENSTRGVTQQYPQPPPPQPQQQSRMRSASTPTQYNPNARSAEPTPPLPINTQMPNGSWSTVPSTAGPDGKRGSGSSQSTNESSEYSPSQTTSPVTPYGSNDSNLASLRPMRSQIFAREYGREEKGGDVKVKVHFREDLFVILVNRTIDYEDLMEKVGKKIRLCGAKHDNAPFRVRYQDEDGDMISLASNDDLQIALESPSVVLYVV